jgi:hypothetical protein
MRRLPDKSQQVPLHAKRAEHDPGGLIHRFEHRPLLDVELEIRLGIDRIQVLPRFMHARQLDAVLAQGVDQPHAGLVLKLLDLAGLEAAARSR